MDPVAPCRFVLRMDTAPEGWDSIRRMKIYFLTMEPLRIRKDEVGWSGDHREKQLDRDVLNLCIPPWSLQCCAHTTLS